jgi:N-acetylmuramoyl-L-alanine amidase
MRALPVAALAFAFAAMTGTGCAVFPRRPPAPPRPAPGYERLRDTLATVDASGLAGRRIALDPGHGGSFRGALGVAGLTEAEVNLGVALRLRDLLAGHGVQVFLTRASDRDFLTPADSALRADLAERARLAAAFDPDLLISIHHNADPRGAHDVNETQTYYKLGDDGPSLDIAQDVHRALVRNVGIRANKVVPGNFYMLHSSAAPALLTETSYITNPDVEERLRLPEKQELEAQAIFIGLARTFARKVPVIEEFVVTDPAAPLETGRFEHGDPALRARIRGAFDRTELLVDGREVEPVRTGSQLSWSPPEPWRGGPHTARLRVRLSGEGAAPERRVDFEVHRPWSFLSGELIAGPLLDEQRPVAAVRIRALDPWGRIAADSGSVVIRRVAGGGIVPAETTLAVLDGVAWAYFHATHGDSAPDAVFQARVPGDTLMSAPPEAIEFALTTINRFAEGPARTRDWSGWAQRMPECVPLARALGTREPEPRVPWLNRDGFVRLPRDSTGAVHVPALPGYRAWPADSALPPRFVPVAGGALHGRRIVLDPEGGGEDGAGQGPGGTRAASLNLESARILAGFLAAAGAEVRLTREGDLALSEVERVQTSEAFQAERFLRIGHRTAPPRLGHHAASPAGTAWARRSAQALAELGLATAEVTGEAQYVIQQTSCPALFASPASLGDEASEARLIAPGALRAEAYALFLALAREWAPQAAWPTDSLTLLDPAGRPVEDAAVTLGGALVLVTDASGRIRFARTEPGPLEVVVEDSRTRFRGILLESQRGAVLTGTPGR